MNDSMIKFINLLHRSQQQFLLVSSLFLALANYLFVMLTNIETSNIIFALSASNILVGMPLLFCGPLILTNFNTLKSTVILFAVLCAGSLFAALSSLSMLAYAILFVGGTLVFEFVASKLNRMWTIFSFRSFTMMLAFLPLILDDFEAFAWRAISVFVISISLLMYSLSKVEAEEKSSSLPSKQYSLTVAASFVWAYFAPLLVLPTHDQSAAKIIYVITNFFPIGCLKFVDLMLKWSILAGRGNVVGSALFFKYAMLGIGSFYCVAAFVLYEFMDVALRDVLMFTVLSIVSANLTVYWWKRSMSIATQ